MDANSVTITSTARTLDDVLSAGPGELNQDTFAMLAYFAQEDAAKEKGTKKIKPSMAKYDVFQEKLKQYCATYQGNPKDQNPIPRHFILVAIPESEDYAVATFHGQGGPYYSGTGSDRYQYAALVCS